MFGNYEASNRKQLRHYLRQKNVFYRADATIAELNAALDTALA